MFVLASQLQPYSGFALSPADPYDPGEQGVPLHAEAPTKKTQRSVDTGLASFAEWIGLQDRKF